MSSADVSTAPTSTTNITGFLTMPRGSSLRTESSSAWAMIFVFQRLFFSVMTVRFVLMRYRYGLEKLSCLEEQVFQNRSQAQGREEGERAQNQDHADQQRGEQRGIDREGAGRGRHTFLARQVACQGQHGDEHEEASGQHG